MSQESEEHESSGRDGGATQKPDSGDEKPPKAPPPRWLIVSGVVAGIVALIVLAAWGGERFGYAYVHQSTDDAKVDTDSYTITSKISERVDRIDTDTNRFVRRGQLLVALDDRDERSRLAAAIASRAAAEAQAQQARQTLLLTRDQVATESEQSRGTLDSAKANVASATDTYASSARQSDAARAAVVQARAQLRAAIATLPGARATLTRNALELERDSALVRNGDVDQSDVDSDRALYETSLSMYREDEANVTSARANVVNAEQRLRATQAQAAASSATIGTQRGNEVTARGRLAEVRAPYRITTQEAALATAERQLDSQDAQVRLARDQLAYTRIVSPLSGAVAEKAIAVGQTIAAGQTLFTIVPRQRRVHHGKLQRDAAQPDARRPSRRYPRRQLSGIRVPRSRCGVQPRFAERIRDLAAAEFVGEFRESDAARSGACLRRPRRRPAASATAGNVGRDLRPGTLRCAPGLRAAPLACVPLCAPVPGTAATTTVAPSPVPVASSAARAPAAVPVPPIVRSGERAGGPRCGRSRAVAHPARDERRASDVSEIAGHARARADSPRRNDRAQCGARRRARSAVRRLALGRRDRYRTRARYPISPYRKRIAGSRAIKSSRIEVPTTSASRSCRRTRIR